MIEHKRVGVFPTLFYAVKNNNKIISNTYYNCDINLQFILIKKGIVMNTHNPNQQRKIEHTCYALVEQGYRDSRGSYISPSLHRSVKERTLG